jgi:ATP/maltotriose-dependent transcriptional regulator MalT
VNANVETSAETEVVAIAAETAGIAALRRGDLEVAINALERAVERWQEGGSSSWLARALSIRAEMLAATGDRARAAASRGRARAVADEIGMPRRDRPTIERPLRGFD